MPHHHLQRGRVQPLDLFIVALLALISTYLLWRPGRQPMFIYYTIAYWLGLITSLISQAIR